MRTDRSRLPRRGLLAALIVLGIVAVGAAATLTSPARRTRRHARSASAHAARPAARRVTIGVSVHGRPIRAIRIGAVAGSRTVLVIGCIHGNEPAGIAIARRLETASAPPGSTIWILPDLNPDGVLAHTRQNADHVDLNRNFPWHWRPLGVSGDLQYSGPRPLSEPEAKAAARFITRVRPRITIWFHQPLALVDLSGGDPRVERKFARLVGLPVAKLTRYPGSAVSWGNLKLPGTTAFVVELPPGSLSRMAVARYAKAVLVLADPRTSF